MSKSGRDIVISSLPFLIEDQVCNIGNGSLASGDKSYTIVTFRNGALSVDGESNPHFDGAPVSE
jgi:hypothetical protein